MFSEAKAKDTTSEAKDSAPKAKAKDMTSCPRGASRPRPWPRGLHLCLEFILSLGESRDWHQLPIIIIIIMSNQPHHYHPQIFRWNSMYTSKIKTILSLTQFNH